MAVLKLHQGEILANVQNFLISGNISRCCSIFRMGLGNDSAVTVANASMAPEIYSQNMGFSFFRGGCNTLPFIYQCNFLHIWQLGRFQFQ